MAITRTGANIAGKSFTPEIWSKKLLWKFYAASVCNEICNTEWQGEVQGQGDKVYIRKRPDVLVNPYTVNSVINWQDINDDKITLTIDYAFSAAAKIDTVDMNQMDINLQAEIIDEISNNLRIAIEDTVLGGAYASATTSLSSTAWQTSTNSITAITQAQAALNALNVPVENRWLLMHPSAAQYLLAQTALYALNAGTNEGALQRGYVGHLAGFQIYQSSRVPGAGTSGSPFKMMAGHISAITLATQFTQFETDVPLQDYFGKGIRALNCFGYKVAKPESLVYMPTTIS